MIGTTTTYLIIGASIVINAAHTIATHEKGHSLEYDKEGIKNHINYFRGDNGKFSFRKLLMPSCNAKAIDVAQLTPKERINGLSAGYKRNYKFALAEAFLAGASVIGAGFLIRYGVADFNTALNVAQIGASIFGIGAVSQGLFGAGNHLIPMDGVIDGTRVRNIKKAIKNYEKKPTLENNMKLQITKILGIKENSKKYDIEIKDNIACIHSKEKEVKGFKVLGEYDYYTYLKYEPDTEKIDLISYNTKDDVEKSPEFLKAEKDFKNYGKEIEKLVEIYKEPEFRFTSEKKSKVIPVKKEPVKDKGMDI